MNLAWKGIHLPEETLGAVKVWYGLSGKRYAMFFTSERMILAKILKYADIDLKDKAFLAKTVGPYRIGGFGGVSGLIGMVRRHKRARETEEKFEALEELSPTALLERDEENFSIPYREVQVVEIKKPGIVRDATIKVKTADKEYKFTIIERKKGFNRCVELVSKVLGSKLSVG
jgi:hypothetical protein